jgi:hypothetical protein
MMTRAAVRNGLYVLAVWLTALLTIISGQFADPDLWGRLSIAALFFQNGHFPYHDAFSYTAPNARWIDHEWLTGMVFYQLFAQFGETGFLVFKYGIILGLFYLLFRLHTKAYASSPLFAFYGLLLLFPIYSIGLMATIRSHIFTFFLFILFLYLLERVRLRQRSARLLWWLLPLGVIWGNLHGGFIVGVILVALYGLGEVLAARSLKAGVLHFLLAAGIFLLTGLLNPYGLDYLAFLVHAWTLNREHVAEWHSLDLASLNFWPAQLMAAMTLVVVLLRWLWADRQSPRICQELLTPSLALLFTTAMTIKGVRFQPFLAWTLIAFSPIFLSPGLIQRCVPQGLRSLAASQSSAFRNTLPVLLLAGAIGGLGFLGKTSDLLRVRLDDELSRGRQPSIRYPLGAFNFLRRSPYQGNLSVRFGLGEFAYWALYPRFKVSMDGRYEEVYSQDEFMRNFGFYNEKHPFNATKDVAYITGSKADFILTEPKMMHIGVLMNDPHWKMIYGDDYYLLFGRVTTLEKFPEYRPVEMMLTTQIFTIEDFVTPQDMRRFRW